MTKYYDCSDSDVLLHESVEEAIENYLERWMYPAEDIAALIKAQAPITVNGYDPLPVDAAHLTKGFARQLIELAIESFDENYGNPDEPTHVNPILQRAAEEAVAEALARLFVQLPVWRCKKVEQFELGAKAIERMMREHRPDWFEKKE